MLGRMGGMRMTGAAPRACAPCLQTRVCPGPAGAQYTANASTSEVAAPVTPPRPSSASGATASRLRCARASALAVFS